MFFQPVYRKLIPLSAINIDAYEKLRTDCPFLGLPSGLDGLAALQSAVFDAYQRLIDMVNIHPWTKLNRLQDELNKLQAKMNFNFDKFFAYIRCAADVCSAAGASADAIKTNQGVIDSYQRNFINNTGGVLSQSMAEKARLANSMVTQLNDLALK